VKTLSIIVMLVLGAAAVGGIGILWYHYPLIGGIGAIILLAIGAILLDRSLIFVRASHIAIVEFMGRREKGVRWPGPNLIPPFFAKLRTESLSPRKATFKTKFFTSDGNEGTVQLQVLFVIDPEVNVLDGPEAGTNLFVSIHENIFVTQLIASIAQDLCTVGGRTTTEDCVKNSGVLMEALRAVAGGADLRDTLGIKLKSVKIEGNVVFDKETMESLEQQQQGDARLEAFNKVVAQTKAIEDPDRFMLAWAALQGEDSGKVNRQYFGGLGKFAEILAKLGGKP
jgi:regulator of protease activity HflC (stomatin/prohibitin superfamily)